MENRRFFRGRKPWINENLRKIQLTAVFLVISTIASFASLSYAQSTKLTVVMKNAKVISILSQIEDQSEFRFFFSNDVDVDRKTSVDQKDATVFEVLEVLFQGTNVKYEVYDRQIALVDKSDSFFGRNFARNQNFGQQQRTVSGSVIDTKGQPLPGVTVLIKGTTQGTVTSADGTYSIVNVPADATIVYSFVGMRTKEVPVANQTVINVTMEEETIGIEEVVAVGYGVQKKVNLTGSVTTVGADKLEKKIVSQASQLLQGETTGVTVTQTSGRPGYDGADLKVRGLGTWSGAGTNPLVLVDGVPSSINSVNPNDIESITVLKDAASSAIYGSRAANGVIIVTTKQGVEGSMQVSYDSYIGKQKATELPHFADSWTYAEMFNEALINAGQNPLYSQDDINKFRSGTDPDNYPNKKHLEDLVNSNNGLQTKHNLTFKGGMKDALYFFSAGYLKQNGLVEKNTYDRYDLMLNVRGELRDNLVLNVKLSGVNSTEKRPAGVTTSGMPTSDMMSIMGNAHHDAAVAPGKKSDGTYGIYMGHPVPEAVLATEGFGETIGTSLTSIGSIEWNIIEGLKLTDRFSYRWSHSRNRLFGAEHTPDPNWTFGPSQASVTHSIGSSWLNEILLDFDRTFGSHYLHLLAGFSAESNTSEALSGYRDNFPTNKLFVLSAASAVNDSNSESLSTYKLESYFGRFNYSFQDKYLLEGNLRYDGSSRFAEGNRFGLFPSFSAGWRVSEEEFFQVPWIANLKLRGSYGVLGNQSIGNYPYQKVLSLGSIWVMGESEQFYPGIQLTSLPFADITWETTKITNGGIDISVLDGKLSLSVDRYYKLTDNILYALSVSQVLGMSVGQQNAGSVENKGWEFELVHENRIGDLTYSITPNFSVNKNKVLDLAGVEKDISRGLFINEPLQSIYGYKTDGLFVDAADIAGYATQNYTVKPGFPRYVDLSGPDGKPDGIISSAYDRTILGSSFPRHSYGMGISAGYKGFDFFTQLQGQGGHIKLIGGDELAFDNYGNIQMWHIENRWTPDNPDPKAKYPRLEMAYHGAPWNDYLDYWTRNSTFLRIKHLQLGYDFSSKFLRNSHISKLRVYIHGENIKTFDYFYPGWDPEMETSGYYAVNYYPITSLWSLGINVQF
jgi:TonB-linked SusC/RagA family outer membrane protein